MISFAPIQGFTDLVYRKAFSETFTGVDTFFIPYISLKNGVLPAKYLKEVLPENNPQHKVVPQILPGDGNEMTELAKILRDLGYTEINLNLGCPYPMVTRRGKGAGLLPFPEKIRAILSEFFNKTDMKLSVKFRSGLVSEKETEPLTGLFNSFSLTEIIFHPRVASQIYGGEINNELFQQVAQTCQHRVVYNGDLISESVFRKKQELFPATTDWMLGRGILMNPFLPAEISGIDFSPEEKQEKLEAFHQRVFDLYSEKMDNAGNVLNKMKQFWIYFSFVFPRQPKVFKIIKKTKDIAGLKMNVQKIFQSGISG